MCIIKNAFKYNISNKFILITKVGIWHTNTTIVFLMVFGVKKRTLVWRESKDLISDWCTVVIDMRYCFNPNYLLKFIWLGHLVWVIDMINKEKIISMPEPFRYKAKSIHSLIGYQLFFCLLSLHLHFCFILSHQIFEEIKNNWISNNIVYFCFHFSNMKYLNDLQLSIISS